MSEILAAAGVADWPDIPGYLHPELNPMHVSALDAAKRMQEIDRTINSADKPLLLVSTFRPTNKENYNLVTLLEIRSKGGCANKAADAQKVAKGFTSYADLRSKLIVAVIDINNRSRANEESRACPYDVSMR